TVLTSFVAVFMLCSLARRAVRVSSMRSSLAHSSRQRSFVGGASVRPVAADMGVVRVGGTFPGFHKRLQAHQINRPLGAAMVHEFHRLLPTLVFEEDDGMVACLLEIKVYPGADPFLRPVDHLP